MIKHTL